MQRHLQIVAIAIAASVWFGLLCAQEVQYPMAPTMNAGGSIMDWQRQRTPAVDNHTTKKFHLGLFERSPSRGGALLGTVHGDPAVAQAQLGPPLSNNSPVTVYQSPSTVSPADPSLPIAPPSHGRRPGPVPAMDVPRQVDLRTLLASQYLAAPVVPQGEEIALPPPSQAPPIPDPRDFDAIDLSVLNPASKGEHKSSESPSDRQAPMAVPSESAPQRLPEVRKPEQVPSSIGESQETSPSLFDAYRKSDSDVDAMDLRMIVPQDPKSAPVVEGEITGVTVPEVPPITNLVPSPTWTPSRGDGGSTITPEIIELPPVLSSQSSSDNPSNISAAQEFAPPNGSVRRTGKWWDQEIQRRLLRFEQARPMSLEQACAAALRYSPELYALTAEVDSRGYEVAVRKAGFDWTVFVDSIWEHRDDPVGDQLAGAQNRLEVDDYGTTAGGRRLNRLGGDVEIAHRTGFLNSNSIFFDPLNQANQRFSIDLNQPLLRGAGFRVNNSPIDLAQIAHQVSVEELQVGIEQQLQRVAVSYWTLVAARARFLQARASWHRAHALLEIVEKRQQIDAGPDNINRIRSTTASRYAETVAAEYDVVRAQEALLREILGSNYSKQHDFEVITATLPPEPVASTDVAAEIEVGLANRPEIRRAVRQIQAASVEHRVAKNELLPVLDMVLSTYSASLRGNKNFAGAMRDQFNNANPGVLGGFNFEVPVRNRAAKARERQTVASIKRFEADMQSVVADIALEVRDRWLAHAQASTEMNLKSQALVSAHEDLDYVDARKRYLLDGPGFTDLYMDNLLRAQDRLQDAENELLQAEVGHAIAGVDLIRATGTLRQTVMGAPNVRSFEKPQIVK